MQENAVVTYHNPLDNVSDLARIFYDRCLLMKVRSTRAHALTPSRPHARLPWSYARVCVCKLGMGELLNWSHVSAHEPGDA